MLFTNRFKKVSKVLLKVSVLGLFIGTGTLLTACQSNEDRQGKMAETTSVSSKKMKSASKVQENSKSQMQQTEASSSKSTESKTVDQSESVSESETSSQKDTATTVTITSGDQAVAYLKQQVGSQYPSTAEDEVIYGFIDETTVQGQKAYRVEIGKDNGRSTIAVYYVLNNGKIIQDQ